MSFRSFGPLGTADQKRKNALKISINSWGPDFVVDLHKWGFHYFDKEYFPTILNPETYAFLLKKGITPPNAFPINISINTQKEIDNFLDTEYCTLENGGVQYLGTEYNLQTPEDWDNKKIKVCFIRTTSYSVADGSFGHYIVSNFIQDYTDDIFIDFSFAPEKKDIAKFMKRGLPLWFGNITKRPLTDFDIIFIASSYPPERFNIPFLMVKSGIPLYLWERRDINLPYYKNTPIVVGAGIGNTFIENLIGDNPIHGIAGNSVYDYILLGEGELTALKFIQEYKQTVIEQGKSKEEFRKIINNKNHSGIYDPTKILFEYARKEYKDRVFENGGHINRISLIDEENKIKYVLAGAESDEFQDLEKMNDIKTY
jgi:hypothetical protein